MLCLDTSMMCCHVLWNYRKLSKARRIRIHCLYQRPKVVIQQSWYSNDERSVDYRQAANLTRRQVFASSTNSAAALLTSMKRAHAVAKRFCRVCAEIYEHVTSLCTTTPEKINNATTARTFAKILSKVVNDTYLEWELKGKNTWDQTFWWALRLCRHMF